MRSLQYWTTGPGTSEIREADAPTPGEGRC